jgi:hypothetical protein
MDAPGVLHQVSRRATLGMAYAAGLAALTGCGLRLDLPPPPPPIPTRRLVPDEKLLIGLVRDLDALAAEAAAVAETGRATRSVATVRGLLTRQTKVLVGRLTNDGVPTSVIRTGAPTGSPSTTTPPAAQSEPTVAALAKGLASIDAGAWTGLAAATTANRPIALSVQSVRFAGSLLLGGTVPFSPTAGALRPSLVQHTAPLVYGFEVVAAQSEDGARARAQQALAEAHELQRALGGSADPAPGGWALPFPVTTNKEATRLATHLLRTSIAATTTLAAASKEARSLEDLARWSGRVQVLAARWGLPLTAFPGTGP